VRTALFASLALVLSACGDPLLFAALEEKQMCITLPSQTIPGAPDVGVHTVSWRGSFDLGSGIPGLGEKGTTGSIKTTSLELKSSTDMRVITSAQLDLSTAEGPAPYMHYDQPAEVADPYALSMTIDQDIDLFSQLADGKTIEYTISLNGQPPPADWTADITACMSVQLQVDPLEMIKK
jgi:hypothetical protein